MTINCEKIKPLKFGCLTNFPFIEQDFDSNTIYEILCKTIGKLNCVIDFIDTTLEKSINEYINEKFNDMMLNAMYEAETETLILFLDRKDGE